MTDIVTVGRAEGDPSGLDARRRKAATIADPKARELLRKADPVLARLIDARPDFRPRALAEVLRASGLSARKGATLWALAERFIDGRLSDEILSRLTDDEVEAALTEVLGIGPWTARGFLLVALDRPDVFLSGDLALRRTIQRAYGFDHLPTDEELVELSDRWRPYRSLAVSYLFASEYEGGT